MGEWKTYVCEKCGTTVRIGQFPICHGDPAEHGPWTGAEEPMEEMADEHLTDQAGEEKHFTTRRELVRFLDKENLQPHKPRDPLPKTARGSTGKLLFFDMKH